jgi:hypothetical protein
MSTSIVPSRSTFAWQPRRELCRTSKALSRMSFSSSSISDKRSPPLITYTWHVEQAHTPPQALPSGAPEPWAACKMLEPTGTSASLFCLTKRMSAMKGHCLRSPAACAASMPLACATPASTSPSALPPMARATARSIRRPAHSCVARSSASARA